MQSPRPRVTFCGSIPHFLHTSSEKLHLNPVHREDAIGLSWMSVSVDAQCILKCGIGIEAYARMQLRHIIAQVQLGDRLFTRHPQPHVETHQLQGPADEHQGRAPCEWVMNKRSGMRHRTTREMRTETSSQTTGSQRAQHMRCVGQRREAESPRHPDPIRVQAATEPVANRLVHL
jgi:hypothetical protein